MLQYVQQGRITLEKVVEKMSHAVADCFRIRDRGYIREGYFADLVIVDMNGSTKVRKENLLSKCNWSPFEGETFRAAITHTFVNGRMVYTQDGGAGQFDETVKGQRLQFDRN